MSERGPMISERWAPPRMLPQGWRVRMAGKGGGAWYLNSGIAVLATGAVERDGREWVHLSVSHARRLPTFEELRDIKAIVLGELEGYMVFPPRERYVNLHPNCLHVFACLDGPALPDFQVAPGEL